MKTNKKEQKKYSVKVLRAKEVKEGTIVFDLVVNDVTIHSMWYREYTNKEGKEGTLLSFPSYKGTDDNYYEHVWFPINASLKDVIIAQIEDIVNTEELPFK